MNALHQAQNAVLAADGIPLHYGDLRREYHAALEAAVLMERSHEGRFEVSGRDRLEIMHRISTNDLITLEVGEGRPTIFTNANARILDRATVFNRGEQALVLTEPGRGDALRLYLQRNIFFNDEARLADSAKSTREFVLHGIAAESIGELFAPQLAPLYSAEIEIAGAKVLITRDKPLWGGDWRLIVANEHAPAVWAAVIDAGKVHGLIPAGSLTYNLLRIRAGRPGAGHELSLDYLPLEVGLWDEISFTKGCYTGQEIIARMESRKRLAKTIVRLHLDEFVEAPAKISLDGREIGTLTSSVQSPDNEIFGIGVIKVAAAQPDMQITVGDGVGTIIALAGSQPVGLLED